MISLRGVCKTYVLDTGATHSVISEKFALSNNILISPAQINVRVADGAISRAIGQVRMFGWRYAE